MELLQQLVKNKIIDKKISSEVKDEMIKTGKTPEELLLEKKLIQESDLFKLKSEVLNIPLRENLPDEVMPDVLSLIPKESVEYYKIFPFRIDRENKLFEVGMVYPESIQAQEALKFLARQHKLILNTFLITPSTFAKYLNKYDILEKEFAQALEGIGAETETKGLEDRIFEKAELGRLVEEAPTIKMVAVILRQAVEGAASDIHIEPTSVNSRVRFRFDGVLYASLFLPLKIHPAIVARIKILSNLKIDETRVPQDGRFSTQIASKRVDFRVSTFPTTLGEKVVIRILDPEKGLKTFENLGLEGRNFDLLKEAIDQPYGMILVTGPTGSGKTTTLYAVLNILNNDGVNIVTLEDPVEYFLEGVNQSQVKPEINYTFARGLRQILRQDPDIIMVGEIRDEETASLAIHAALTGHLVLSTLHTNNASGVVPRLIDMGIRPFLIPPSLNLTVGQRLVRVLCPVCKQKAKAEGEAKKYLLEKIKSFPEEFKKKVKMQEPFYVYKAEGCKQCGNKGYSGRTAVFEVIKMTDKMAEILYKEPTEQAFFKEARAQGMTTMEEDGILKVLQGITSVEEVLETLESK